MQSFVQGESSSTNENNIMNLARSSHGSYSMNGALELMARNSINSYHGRASNMSSVSLISQTDNMSIVDEQNWNWKHLRVYKALTLIYIIQIWRGRDCLKEFHERELETQWERYAQRLRGGYFVVYLIVNFVLFLGHICMIVFSNENMSHINRNIPDIISYSLIAILPLTFLFIKEKYIKKYNWIHSLTSCLFVTFLTIVILFGTIVHENPKYFLAYPSLRPAFVEHILLGCYVFLPVARNYQAIILGITVTLNYLFILAAITYRLSNDRIIRICSDLIYLSCINGIGIYLRFINEIVIRRMFLDGRKCVQTTMKLNFQKNKEDRLMLSILPPHMKKRVQEDIETIYNLMNKSNDSDNFIKPFDDLYIEQHSNVTILYADIVNYTKMTTTVPVKKLVEILNELFGKFDDASEDRKVVRIKFLGDCYYCVAGIPQVGDTTAHLNHAKKAVDFGLDMIFIIKSVRENHDLDIDMRIGIHSGKILSGLIGSCKWQYDIWSKDVKIANRMEQTGKTGKIHLTNETLTLLDKNLTDYIYERGYGETRDSFLNKHNIITYLISPKIENVESVETQAQTTIYKRTSNNTTGPGYSRFSYKSRKNSTRLRKFSISERTIPISNRRTLFMDDTNREFQEMVTLVDTKMDEEIEKLPVGKYEQYFKSQYINPFLLLFYNYKWEWQYFMQPDPLYKFYIVAVICILLCIFVIHLLASTLDFSIGWISWLLVSLLLLILIPLTWTQYFWLKWTKKDKHIDEPVNKLIHFLNNSSNYIVFNTPVRTFIYVLVLTIMLASLITELIPQCTISISSDFLYKNIFDEPIIHYLNSYISCIKPWNITEIVSLIIFVCFIFLRINFLVKLISGIVITILYSFIILKYRQNLFKYSESWNVGLEPQICHVLSIVYLTFTLHVLDRQHEYMNRLDYQWKMRLIKERDEAATTDQINLMLLQNILPLHVAKIYMNPRRESNSLYYEEYSSVSVMFASLKGFDDTLGIDDDNTQKALVMLSVLNNIICDFDKLLLEHEGIKVEKIKMADWTYIAACGLEPGKRDSQTSYSFNTENAVVLTLTKLAIKFMKALKSFGKEAQQKDLKLRIGISHGKVSAGVVGAKKPLYDIWGDTVNMASRMDSTGVPNKIQVTPETAQVLKNQRLQCDLRGNIFVKGKNMVKTYFVRLDDNFDMVPLEHY